MDLKITAYELRELLFEMIDQDLTVEDLRHRFFNINEQDKPLTIQKIRDITK